MAGGSMRILVARTLLRLALWLYRSPRNLAIHASGQVVFLEAEHSFTAQQATDLERIWNQAELKGKCVILERGLKFAGAIPRT
jgi:hypothetical protein